MNMLDPNAPVSTARPGHAPESIQVAVGLNIDDSVQGGPNKVTLMAFNEDGKDKLQVLGEGMEASREGAEIVIQMLVLAAEALSGALVVEEPKPAPKRPRFNPQPRGKGQGQ